MLKQRTVILEPFRTQRAFVSFLVRMTYPVFRQSACQCEPSTAHGTLVRLLRVVHHLYVSVQDAFRLERHRAQRARKRSVLRVYRFLVHNQMVGETKRFLAQIALVRLISSMTAHVFDHHARKAEPLPANIARVAQVFRRLGSVYLAFVGVDVMRRAETLIAHVAAEVFLPAVLHRVFGQLRIEREPFPTDLTLVRPVGDFAVHLSLVNEQSTTFCVAFLAQVAFVRLFFRRRLRVLIVIYIAFAPQPAVAKLILMLFVYRIHCTPTKVTQINRVPLYILCHRHC